ncbi:MAG: cold shock domain-containing protein [Bacteroides sp.]|nr:cold shock domain-containing protein [Bacteroides sp.]
MAKSISSNKRELEKKKQSKRLEKQKRKEERKASGGGSLDDMIAYVDENGRITDTPPDLTIKKEEIDVEQIAVSTPRKEEVEESPVRQGQVEYFNDSKGFGFIRESGGKSEKYFFHISSAPATITEGKKVTFELERGPKGMNAVQVRFADEKATDINN